MTETAPSPGLERRLDVAVPLRDIEGEVQKRLANLAKSAKVPGFRPGHVPLKMVEQQYGPQVRSDVITEAVRTRLNEAIRSQNLRVPASSRTRAPRGRARRSSSRRCSRSSPRSRSATSRR